MSQAITTNGAAVASAQVFTVVPLHIADACMLVSWSRRATKQNPIEPGDRYRGIVVERAALAIAPDACSSKFQRLLQSSIHNLADSMFQQWAGDNMAATQYDGAPITVDNVLSFWADRKARETIDGAAVLAWLKASKTHAALPSDQHRAKWEQVVPKIAAPAYRGSFTQDEASKIAARIVEEDADSPVGLFVLQRLSTIIGTVSQADLL
jgi:hypothetical protein